MARAKGLTENAVIWKHMLKNALIPIVTVVGLNFGTLLGGSVPVSYTHLSGSGIRDFLSG